MRRNWTRTLVPLAVLTLGSALGLQAQTPVGSTVAELPKIEAPEDCAHCGMNRTQFSHSRMKVTYEDGTSAGTCSIHCLITELAASSQRKPASIQVGDYGVDGNPLIDARKAIWVIGGSVRGVMTPVAKWAFSTPAAANAFVAKHGGKVASYDEALEAARRNPKKRH